MRDVTRVRTAVGRRHRLHVVEVGPPGFGDRTGVVQVVFIQLLDIRSVAAEQIGVRAKGLHHDASPCRTSFSSKMLRAVPERNDLRLTPAVAASSALSRAPTIPIFR
jgi:hypothetical protein